MKINKKKVIIPKRELVEGRLYWGEGRNGEFGYWNGKNFEVTSVSTWADPARYPAGGRVVRRVKNEEYYSARSGTFKPYVIAS